MKSLNYLLIFVIVFAAALVFFGIKSNSQDIIGGERDENGCLGPAGYSFNEEANACIREWELNEDQRKAASIAVEEVGYEKGITIIEVVTTRCQECFSVKLEKEDYRRTLLIENWTVS